MSVQLKMTRQSDLQSSDEVIGRSISNSLNECGPDGSCPSLEEIAILVDGGPLSAERRDFLFGHMACCASCREAYALSRELLAPQQTVPQRKTWYITASALAAAAVVVFFIIITLNQGDRDGRRVAVTTIQQIPVFSPENGTPAPTQTPSMTSVQQRYTLHAPPPGAEQTALILIKGQNPSSFLDRAGNIRGKTYGFATVPSSSKAAFVIGVNSLIFEVAILTNDRETAGMALLRIGQYLPAAGGNPRLVSMIDERKELVYQGELLDRLKGVATKLEKDLPAQTLNFIRFGVWCEASRLEAVLGKRDFLNLSAISYFEQNIPKDQLPPEADNVLKEIATGLSKPHPDLEELRRNLEKVMKAFM